VDFSDVLVGVFVLEIGVGRGLRFALLGESIGGVSVLATGAAEIADPDPLGTTPAEFFAVTGVDCSG
jgi:hypothetical protein